MAPPSVGSAAAEGETVEPMSHIRKAIASHMLASVNETARAWTMVEVNVEQVVRLRERAKDAFLATHGVKLTYLPFVVRASVDALTAYPAVNSRIVGDDIVTPRAVHLGHRRELRRGADRAGDPQRRRDEQRGHRARRRRPRRQSTLTPAQAR